MRSSALQLRAAHVRNILGCKASCGRGRLAMPFPGTMKSKATDGSRSVLAPGNDKTGSEGGNLVTDESTEDTLTADLARPGTATQKNTTHIEAALRDLIWSVDHVRSFLQDPENTHDPQELLVLLDTRHVHAALGLGGVEPPKATGQTTEIEGEAHDRQGHQIQR